mmetsp:Transcript_21509/g.69238  ORF Transcript_21509/g.69238 Transcript_21509/m.69238 type:complete len:514 (+) Transcript_21509:774-2315(+)
MAGASRRRHGAEHRGWRSAATAGLCVAVVLILCGHLHVDREASPSAALRARGSSSPPVDVEPLPTTLLEEEEEEDPGGADEEEEEEDDDDEKEEARDGVDFSLVTQASSDRAWLLSFFCDRWPGAISAAVLGTDAECADAAVTITRIAKTAGCGSERLEVNLTGGGSSQSHEKSSAYVDEVANLRRGRLRLGLFRRRKAGVKVYPINALRNAAVAATSTSHVLVLDVDFAPSVELYEALQARRSSIGEAKRLAVVVPAFQRKGDRIYGHMKTDEWRERLLGGRPEKKKALLRGRDDVAPSTLASLASCLARARCVVFDSTWNPFGHSTTDSATWLVESTRSVTAFLNPAVKALTVRRSQGHDPKPTIRKDLLTTTPLRRIPCFQSPRFEPYLVVRADEVPPFNESFTGYGKNKIEFVTRLRYLAFHFAVLPVGFVCHIPHPLSRDKETWLHEKRGKRPSDKLYAENLNDMQQEIRSGKNFASVENRTWLCDPPQSSSGSSAAPGRRNKIRATR